MKVSVVVPVWNLAHLLPEALQSLQRQTRKPDEILVVDDGSNTDDCCRVAENFNVEYLWHEHAGLARTLNRGIRETSGMFFLGLAADDKLHSQYIEKCLVAVRRNVGFVWTATREFGGSDKVRLPRKPYHRLSFLRNPGGQLGAALIRREAYNQVGGYDERLKHFEDWDLAIRILKRGWKTACLSEPLHYSRVHQDRMTSQNNVMMQAYEMLKMKHPLMNLYVPLSRIFDALVLSIKNPRIAEQRFLEKIGFMIQ